MLVRSYPHALFFLDMVQSPDFRTAIGQAAVKVRAETSELESLDAAGCPCLHALSYHCRAGTGPQPAILFLAALPSQQAEPLGRTRDTGATQLRSTDSYNWVQQVTADRLKPACAVDLQEGPQCICPNLHGCVICRVGVVQTIMGALLTALCAMKDPFTPAEIADGTAVRKRCLSI